MCGLVGVIGSLFEQDKKAFRTMLRLDVIRGEDSTGIAAINKIDNKVSVYKKVGAPDILFNSYSDFENNGIYKGPTPKILIGHNRAATKGKVTDENAHPFHHGSVVGAHNGTLTSVSHLEKGDTFEVDSEAIFYNLNKYDNEDVISDIYGAYALTWYDSLEDKLFVIRNSQRPLYWTRRKDKDAIFWSSRKDILELSLDMAHVLYEEPQEFEKDVLYSFDAGAITDGKTKSTSWEMKKGVIGYQPPPTKVITYDYGSRNYGGRNNNVSPFPGTSSRTSTTSYTASNQGRTTEELATMKALQGQKILFRINSPKKGMGKMEYLSCYPDNPMFDWDIRLFAHKHRYWNKWKNMAHSTTFQGEVRRMVTMNNSGRKEVYLLIDLRTVQEFVKPKEEEDVDGKFYEGFNGVYLTHKEYLKATNNGCAGCTRDADNTGELVFISDEDFLCGDCASMDLYKEYIPNLK